MADKKSFILYHSYNDFFSQLSDEEAGQLIKVYVASIKEENGTSYANISRKHPGLVKRLFETEVPEIYDGVVEIVSVSREAGSRTKIAVFSKDDRLLYQSKRH